MSRASVVRCTHPDPNTPEKSPTENIHGMTVAISLGFGREELVKCMGSSPKVLAHMICILGAKDINREEMAFLEKMGVQYTSHLTKSPGREFIPS